MAKNYLRYAVATAFFLGSAASNQAAAVLEDEGRSNDSISSAQSLGIGDTRKIEVQGAIGVRATATPVVSDVDFYSFRGRAGDVVTVDIDDGMKLSTTVRSLNALVAVFGPDLTVLRQVDDVPAGSEDRPGSISRFDPRIDSVVLPVSGVYTVGVTSAARYPDGSTRVFIDGGGTTPFVPTGVSNGSYVLVIEGVSPSVKQISIDIKPRAKKIVKINPQSKRKIKVALLSSPDFDPMKADRGSITFGPVDGVGTTGTCGNYRRDDDDEDDDDDDDGKHMKDYNKDGRPDLVCRFEIRAAGFDESDAEGMIRGTADGMPFEGRGWLKVIPVRKRHPEDD